MGQRTSMRPLALIVGPRPVAQLQRLEKGWSGVGVGAGAKHPVGASAATWLWPPSGCFAPVFSPTHASGAARNEEIGLDKIGDLLYNSSLP